MKTPEQRAKHAAYMRQWTRDHREHLCEQRRAKVRAWRLEPIQMRACVACGREFPLTAHARSIRTRKCNRCLTLKDRQKNQRRMRAAHPERYRAYDAVRRAIRKGLLVRLACESCGDPKTHAHHEDYSKPLDVQWLCRDCHETAHHPARAVA